MVANIITDVTDWLDDISANWWFLLVIFVIALLDSVIPIVPSETAVIVGGVAAGAGDQELGSSSSPARSGAFLGDNIAYMIGHASAHGYAAGRERKTETANAASTGPAEQIRERGGLLLITARFIPGGRTVLTVSSGLTGQPRRWFVGWVAVAVADLGQLRGPARLRLRRRRSRTTTRWRSCSRSGPRCRSRRIVELVRCATSTAASDDTADESDPARSPSAVPIEQPLIALVTVVPVRDGVLPAGADETVAECGGRSCSPAPASTTASLAGLASRRPPARARHRSPRRVDDGAGDAADDLADGDVVVLPGSPDGRDLAPRLARRARPAAARRRHHRDPDRGARSPAAAASNSTTSATEGPFVATLQPGVRGIEPCPGRHRRVSRPSRSPTTLDDVVAGRHGGRGAAARRRDDGPRRGAPHRRRRRRARPAERFGAARRVAGALGASMGATRVDHRPRLGRPRAPDRHHRRRRRPRPVRGVRHQRRRAAHGRARRPGAHHQRQHRPALPDDADGRPGRRGRRQRRCSTS